MNAAEIELALWHGRRSSSRLVLPRFAPVPWWECDLWCVSKAGYSTEFEIKTSAADFRRDVDKVGWMRAADGRREVLRKHDLLAAGDVRGPSRFFFVMPTDLVPLSAVPEWAGVMWAGLGLRVVRPARRLHNEQVPDAVMRQAYVACYWRFWEQYRGRLAQAARLNLEAIKGVAGG